MTASDKFTYTALALNIAIAVVLYCVGYIATVQQGAPNLHFYKEWHEILDPTKHYFWVYFILINSFIVFPLSISGIFAFGGLMIAICSGTLYLVYLAVTASVL